MFSSPCRIDTVVFFYLECIRLCKMMKPFEMLTSARWTAVKGAPQSLVSRYRRGSYQVIKYSHLYFLERCLCCAVKGDERGELKHQSLTNLFLWSWRRPKQNLKWSKHCTSFIRWTQVTLWLLVAHTHRAVNVWLKSGHICSFLWVKVWIQHRVEVRCALILSTDSLIRPKHVCFMVEVM